MTSLQNLKPVACILLVGPAIAEWCAEHHQAIVTVLIVGIFGFVTYSIVRSNRTKRVKS